MPDSITLVGIVATPPRVITTPEGLAITSFRLASSQRRFDRALDRWVDGETNWYTITAFRQLAVNLGVSVHKGERVVVSGRLRVRDWTNGDKTGTNIEVDADALGHDLSWGTAAFSRSVSSMQVGRSQDATDHAQPDPQAEGAEGGAVVTKFPTAAALASVGSTSVAAGGASTDEVPF